VKRYRNWFRQILLSTIACALLLGITGCKSYWINASIENQTGQTIHELEVDYPTASFGTNSLTPGASMRYRFQVRGSGPVKVEYTLRDGKTTHAQGLTLAEHQKGELLIRLLPQGKVEFSPKLEPAS
jgi:hypothetical protein